MADTIYYTRHDGGLTLMKNGKQSTVSSSHPNFERVLSALKGRRYDEVETLMSIERTITKTGASRKTNSKVYAENGKVFFFDSRNRKTIELHGSLVDRILRDLGKPGAEKYADSLMALMENIQKNPIKDVAAELYEWLSSGQAPITPDGCVLAYKKVRRDYKDHYTGTMDNSLGVRVKMKQGDVDPDRRNECSRGLHFASLGYLSHYSGDASSSRVMIVKVNPRHIFAIPRDYNCQKGRASEYLVVGEYLSADREKHEAFKDAFVNEDNKLTAAPDVEFVPGALRPSLESIAEGYDIVRDGRVKVLIDEKGNKTAIQWDGEIAEREDEFVTIMSFETKSVRAAVKDAVAAFERS